MAPHDSLAQTYDPVIGGPTNTIGYQHKSSWIERISAKTASYSVLESEFGTTFTTRGATAAVTFTLPAVTNLTAGMWYRFYNVSAYGLVVASNGSSDNIVFKNDAGADSITCTTTSLMIGACVKVIWDGTGWLGIAESGGPTYTGA